MHPFLFNQLPRQFLPYNMVRLLAIMFTLLCLLYPYGTGSQANEQTPPAILSQSFEDIIQQAKGQTVYWHAWGGSTQYNDFIAWVGSNVQQDYGVTLKHVQITDTALAVRSVLAEKQAGISPGQIDLIWINGLNFQAMQKADLLLGSYVNLLPYAALINAEENPAVSEDFGVPTEGKESPWGMARLNFGYDIARTPKPPRSPEALLRYAQDNPGRLSYPTATDFTGMAFVKQLLLSLTDSDSRLYQPVEQADFTAVTAPLWAYLDALHPHLWRQGQDFPANENALLSMLNNNAVDLSISYNIGAVSSAIARGDLPETARSMVFEGGTLGNVNFVTIPFNAPNPAGAMVVANFLLSPEAQARRQNPNIWGDLSVLSYARLSPEQKALFDALPRNEATLSTQELGPILLEPHPSWTLALEQEWLTRYGG